MPGCLGDMTSVACELPVLTASACMQAPPHLWTAAPVASQRLGCPAQHCTASPCLLRAPGMMSSCLQRCLVHVNTVPQLLAQHLPAWRRTCLQGRTASSTALRGLSRQSNCPPAEPPKVHLQWLQRERWPSCLPQCRPSCLSVSWHSSASCSSDMRQPRNAAGRVRPGHRGASAPCRRARHPGAGQGLRGAQPQGGSGVRHHRCSRGANCREPGTPCHAGETTVQAILGAWCTFGKRLG